MRVSSAEFIKNCNEFVERPLAEPLTITRHGRDRLVLISSEEYELLKQQDRRVLQTGDLTEAEVADIMASDMPAGLEHLDEELKGWRP